MKVVVGGETDRILGAAILSGEGGELVQILAFVMRAGAPYTLLKGAVCIHPTLAEGFWTLMEEVKPVDRRTAHRADTTRPHRLRHPPAPAAPRGLRLLQVASPSDAAQLGPAGLPFFSGCRRCRR
jgi:hypothetical protein